ncbi:MAG: glycoside hydrolase family 2 protein [Anaerolineae bacterium]
MHRRFREHDLRVVTDLDGVWDFAFLGDVDPEAVEVAAIPFTDRMAVPGCFDATPAYAGKRGLAAYRRQILLGANTPHRLILDSVHHWCRIFVDGEPVGEHAGGFTRFSVDLPSRAAGVAELVVLVDNRFDYERSPLHLEYFDWYHYGGIAGGIELHRLGGHWIDAVQVTTEAISPPTIRIAISFGAVDPAGASALTVALDDKTILSEKLALTESKGLVVRTVEVPNAELWSPQAPHLHLLHVRLGDDDLRTRIGIRQVTTEDQQILINGEPVRLLGFNRHAFHPQFGHAVPEMVGITDVQLLLDMGANFVRGSHYPQDSGFLDLCDEAGILVWSEAIGWQHEAVHLTDPHFVDAQLAHIDEMVAGAFNHPSVIMWGILNESHSHNPACREAYAALLDRLRELDSTRPVTYASNHPFEDVCLDLVDIVSVNCYPGWYGSEIHHIPEEIDRILVHLDAGAQAHKPVIISEIGAGGIYGWRDWNGARWTESYQARLLETVIRHLFASAFGDRDCDRVMGLAIWQFCDCRTSEAVRKILGRPRGFNSKGIVDEYRRPKQAYDVVKREFHALRAAKG